MNNICPVCLIPYVGHKGLHGTCQDLKTITSEFRDFVLEMYEMEVITASRGAEVLHCKVADLRDYYVLREGRHHDQQSQKPRSAASGQNAD